MYLHSTMDAVRQETKNVQGGENKAGVTAQNNLDDLTVVEGTYSGHLLHALFLLRRPMEFSVTREIMCIVVIQLMINLDRRVYQELQLCGECLGMSGAYIFLSSTYHCTSELYENSGNCTSSTAFHSLTFSTSLWVRFISYSTVLISFQHPTVQRMHTVVSIDQPNHRKAKLPLSEFEQVMEVQICKDLSYMLSCPFLHSYLQHLDISHLDICIAVNLLKRIDRVPVPNSESDWHVPTPGASNIVEFHRFTGCSP